jgi:hypothetical protein
VITPNKAITLEESALGRVSAIMKEGPNPHDLVNLYTKVADEFESIDQFILALDILYVIGKIDVNQFTRVLTYAY